MTRGHTLLELAVALLLLTTLAGAFVPAARRYRDRMSVVSAREEVAGLLSRARALAPATAGASVHIRADAGQAWVQALDSVLSPVGLGGEDGVSVVLSGGRPSAVVRFDALGIGRVASLTVRFLRGQEQAGITVSSFGRIRRW